MAEKFFAPLVDKMWRNWTRIGVERPKMTKLELQILYDWFVQSAKEHYIDPQSIDFEHLIDSTLTYRENQKNLAGFMGIPPPTEEIVEEEPTSLKDLMEKVGVTLPDETDPYYPVLMEETLRILASRLEEAERKGGKVQVISRDKRGRPRKVWMSADKLVDMLGDLNRQMDEYERKLKVKEEELEVAKAVRMTTVRFKKDLPSFVGVDMKVYGPFKAEQIASIPEGNAAILTEKNIVERWVAPPKIVPPTVMPPTLPKPLVPEKGLGKAEEDSLRDYFTTGLRTRGVVPDRFMAEFRIELEEVIKPAYRNLPREEAYRKALDDVNRLVKDIVELETERKERLRPTIPTPPPTPEITPYEQGIMISAESPWMNIEKWLKEMRGLSFNDYMDLSGEEKKRLQEEYLRWVDDFAKEWKSKGWRFPRRRVYYQDGRYFEL